MEGRSAPMAVPMAVPMTMIDPRATAATRARYDRIAPFYDAMECISERRIAPWRGAVWRHVIGPRVLEIGVGTGKNIPYHPPAMRVTAFDLSSRMLERACARAGVRRADLDLCQADAQALPFADASFDTAVGTFVFCSVPDPVLGLRELRRVLKPGGQLLLVEHVLSERWLWRPMMHAVNPLVVRVMGANINRETVGNVGRAGFTDPRVEYLWLDIVLLIEASNSLVCAAASRDHRGRKGRGET